MAHKTINNKWSALSTNRINFSEEEVGVGILYKGAVVSNQLNGLGFAIYEMLDFIQRTGGLYNSAKKYLGDDVVSILRRIIQGLYALSNIDASPRVKMGLLILRQL